MSNFVYLISEKNFLQLMTVLIESNWHPYTFREIQPSEDTQIISNILWEHYIDKEVGEMLVEIFRGYVVTLQEIWSAPAYLSPLGYNQSFTPNTPMNDWTMTFDSESLLNPMYYDLPPLLTHISHPHFGEIAEYFCRLFPDTFFCTRDSLSKESPAKLMGIRNLFAQQILSYTLPQDLSRAIEMNTDLPKLLQSLSKNEQETMSLINLAMKENLVMVGYWNSDYNFE